MNFRDYIEKTASTDKKSTYFQKDVTSRMMYPTGNMGFDYKNGIYNKIFDDNDHILATQHSVGIGAGSLNSIIGKSGVGKTTHCIKDAITNVRPYLNQHAVPNFLREDVAPMSRTFIQILDVEKTIDMNDVKRISQLPAKILRDNVKIDPVNNDLDLIKAINYHIEWKKQHVKPIVFPYRDLFGENIVHYPPSVIIIDAMTKLSVFESESTENYENIKSNTAGARKAKVIGDLLGLMVDIASKYNIIIYNICHINVKISMGFLPQPKQYKGLKQDETISGGEKQIFLSSNIIRYDHEKIINTEKASQINFGEGVQGSLVRKNIIKTKTNAFGGSSPSIFIGSKGVDNLASNLFLAKENDWLGTKGNKFYVPGHAEVPFNFKDYSEVFQEHPELMMSLYNTLRQNLTNKLSSFEDAAKANAKFNQQVLDDDSDFLDANGQLIVPLEHMNEMKDIYKQMHKAIA